MAADYLAFAYALEPGAAGAARDAAQALTDVGWVLRWRRPGLEVWTQGRPEIPVSGDPAGTTVIIGHRFDGSESAASDADDPRAATSALSNARRLIGQSWGAYVALLRDPTGASWILRDPTGAHDALTWTREGLALVASDIALAPARLRPRHLSLDWDVITDFVRRPVSTSARSPPDGAACGRAGRPASAWRRPGPRRGLLAPADMGAPCATAGCASSGPAQARRGDRRRPNLRGL
jgi:asparagine synthase (glutamine-hydrolysing)